MGDAGEWRSSRFAPSQGAKKQFPLFPAVSEGAQFRLFTPGLSRGLSGADQRRGFSPKCDEK